MKINNYIRYFIGIYLGWVILTFFHGKPSLFNYVMFLLLLFVAIRDLANKNNKIKNK